MSKKGKIILSIQLIILVIVVIWDLGLLSISSSVQEQPVNREYTYARYLDIPGHSWLKFFGETDESQIAYNVYMNRRILNSHYQKILEINERLKKIEKRFEGKTLEEAVQLDSQEKPIEDPNNSGRTRNN